MGCSPYGPDPVTGAFTWTSTESQGPGSHDVTIIVTDDGDGNRTDLETVTITVPEPSGLVGLVVGFAWLLCVSRGRARRGGGARR